MRHMREGEREREGGGREKGEMVFVVVQFFYVANKGLTLLRSFCFMILIVQNVPSFVHSSQYEYSNRPVRNQDTMKG